MENKRLDPDVELFEAQDYEVEVPPCERGANPASLQLRKWLREKIG